MRPAGDFTRISLMDADWTFWLARIIFSIWRRRDATKRAWRFRWPGCDTTTNTKKARPWMPRKRTHSLKALATRVVLARATESSFGIRFAIYLVECGREKKNIVAICFCG